LPDWRRDGESYVWANTRRANPGWGWKGAVRKVLAYEAGSGRKLWESESPVAPCSLAAADGRVVFHDGEKLVCLDGKSGDVAWEGGEAPTALPVQTNTGPRVLIYGEVVLFAGNNGKMSGWSLKDGKQLWEQRHRPSGHQSLKDLFVVDGLAWTAAIAGSGDDGTFAGYDPASGKLTREFAADVHVNWFHHRCYPAKASGKYLITGRNGTEFVDLTSEHWKPHHWVRGGCIYGVMPCNGMTYAPMNSCGCQLEAKLTGLNALAGGEVVRVSRASLSGEARLQRGPAYGGKAGAAAGASDWPTYRHDGSRSGASASAVSADLKQVWQAEIGGRLTAVTVAAGKAFVASIDRHTVYAVDGDNGEVLWSYMTGGRVDSPPTYYKGLALFGSADGYVYAVRASDGVLAWRFRGAPIDRRMMAWEQLESSWPVHGSVLVHEDVLYCTAGRNMFVDGGVRLIRLNPVTGQLIGETVMGDTDPATGEDMHLVYVKQMPGNNMPVAHTDILSCDGKHVWMRSQKITLDGKRLEIGVEPVTQQENEDFHVFCQNGFLDDSYFFRSYWTYGRRVSGGYGAWLKAGRLVPSGRILCFDDDAVYGFGRKMEYMVNSSVLEYQFFGADKTVTAAAIDRLGKAEREMNERSKHKNASSSDWKLRYFFPMSDLSAASYQWLVDQPSIIARGMAVAGDVIFAAGPEDLIDERYAFYNPDDPKVQAALERQEAAIEGKLGGQLWAMSKGDGRVVVRYALDTIPVFDGIAAAGGSVYMSTVDGRVVRLGDSGGQALKPVVDSPIRRAWEKKEDPSYLVKPLVRKEGDFAKVARCKVMESELGYRLESTGKKQMSVAVKKLAEPATGLVTLSGRIQAVGNADGLLSNGYLAFGDGTQESRLVKCGAR
ncbi:MAG: PQQ-binding-like beta-propeller repeat protein, partial [Gemmatimonadota bacterium]